jgi:hypothetical protein
MSENRELTVIKYKVMGEIYGGRIADLLWPPRPEKLAGEIT